MLGVWSVKKQFTFKEKSILLSNQVTDYSFCKKKHLIFLNSCGSKMTILFSVSYMFPIIPPEVPTPMILENNLIKILTLEDIFHFSNKSLPNSLF